MITEAKKEEMPSTAAEAMAVLPRIRKPAHSPNTYRYKQVFFIRHLAQYFFEFNKRTFCNEENIGESILYVNEMLKNFSEN